MSNVPNEVIQLQKTFASVQEELQVSAKKVQELVQQRARVQQQHTENSMVMQELELANTEDGVYKLVGPVLMKQEHSEAKETVSRRLEYLTGELKKLDAQLAEQDKVQNTKREKLQEIQAIMHKFVQLSQQQSNRG